MNYTPIICLIFILSAIWFADPYVMKAIHHTPHRKGKSGFGLFSVAAVALTVIMMQ